MNFWFDGNLYSSIFSKNAIKNKALATKWLGTWRDINGEIHHDILNQATTNNEAEYGGMLMILKHLRQYLEQPIHWLEEAIIYGDSQLIIYQMAGKYKVNEPNLKALWLEGINLVHVLKEDYGVGVKFRWVGRELNNEVLGIKSKIKEAYPGLEKEESNGEITTSKASS